MSERNNIKTGLTVSLNHNGSIAIVEEISIPMHTDG